MDLDYSPKSAKQKIFEGEGGSYYTWSSSEYPLLGEAKVGAGRLVLQPHGFALPHFADSSKVGYVLQGKGGVAGMVVGNSSQEEVLSLKKGDVIPVPLGATSWWYNKGDSQLVIVFIGETSKSYIPGEFTYFLLTGGRGILSGFSTEFTSRSYNLNEKDANSLTKSQAGVLIIKLEPGTEMPQPQKNHLVYNIDAASPDVEVKRGGTWKSLRGGDPPKFPFLEETGLSVEQVRLEGNAMVPPRYAADATVQVVFVAKGRGRVQMVGINGKRVLDTQVEAGQLFVVPKFFVFALLAGDDGMECFSIATCARPLVKELNGKKSVWKTLSPKVVRVALSVTPELGGLFQSNIEETKIIIPPTN